MNVTRQTVVCDPLPADETMKSPLRLICTLGVFAASITLAAEPQTKPLLKTEHFDRDPGWEGLNNRVQTKPHPVVQDFGYSPTNHAGGKAPGEIGGRVQRSTISALYGRRL